MTASARVLGTHQHNTDQIVGGAPAHTILSTTHTDTTPDTFVRGDIVTAQGASPLLTRLAKPSPASGILALFGFGNGDAEGAYKTVLDNTAPTTISAGASAASGSALTMARRDHTHGAPATYPATAHNVLSATHGDATAAAVVRGDIITGQGVSPTWARLAISAPAANQLNVLGAANGDTEPAYKLLLDATAPSTQAFGDAAAAGTSLKAAHVDHKHAMPAVANPTGLIGMSAVNGSAATAERSDATHAIDPAIAPTWTGLHTFSRSTTGGYFAELAYTGAGAATWGFAVNAGPTLSLDQVGLAQRMVVIAGASGGIAFPQWVNVGTGTSPSNTTAGDLTAIRAHFGTDGTFSTVNSLTAGLETKGIGVLFGGTITNNTTAGQRAVSLAVTFNGSGDTPQGYRVQPVFQPTASLNAVYAHLGISEFAPPVGVTIGQGNGLYSALIYDNVSGAVTSGIGLNVDSPVINGSLKPGASYGVFIANQGAAGISTVIGHHISAQTGGTNNYDMSFGTVDATGGAGAYAHRIPVLINGVKEYIRTYVS